MKRPDYLIVLACLALTWRSKKVQGVTLDCLDCASELPKNPDPTCEDATNPSYGFVHRPAVCGTFLSDTLNKFHRSVLRYGVHGGPGRCESVYAWTDTTGVACICDSNRCNNLTKSELETKMQEIAQGGKCLVCSSDRGGSEVQACEDATTAEARLPVGKELCYSFLSDNKEHLSRNAFNFNGAVEVGSCFRPPTLNFSENLPGIFCACQGNYCNDLSRAELEKKSKGLTANKSLSVRLQECSTLILALVGIALDVPSSYRS